MSYRKQELSDYLEDCRTRNVNPRLHYVKFLKRMIQKEEQKAREFLEYFLYDIDTFGKN